MELLGFESTTLTIILDFALYLVTVPFFDTLLVYNCDIISLRGSVWEN